MKNIQILFIIFISINFSINTSNDCSDFETIKKTQCEAITSSDTSKSCFVIDNVCTEFYKECTEYTGTDSSICKKITPSNSKKKCTYNKGCEEIDKECSDYGQNECMTIKFDNTRCVYDDGECKENYEKCEDYTEDDSNICTAIKPFNQEKTAINHLKKCVYDENATENKCTETSKLCSDFISGKDDAYCESFISSDPTKKICVYKDNDCKELFKTCEIYNAEETKTKPICESIKPYVEDGNEYDTSSKCIFNTGDNSCTRETKECNEFTTKAECEAHTPKDSKKMCVFTKNGCEEVYQSCGKLNDETDEAKINKGNCESIEVYISDSKIIDYSKNCTFETNSCVEKTKKCDGYKAGQSEEYCTNIVLTDDTKKCALIDGKCVEQPASCGDYKESDRKICESITTGSEYTKCVLDKDTTCTSKQKICSEYLGKSAIECAKYKVSDSSNVCSLVNGKCIEQYKYKYCSDYSGNDQTTCESILPYNPEGTSPLSGYKCVLDSKEGCIRKSKGCSDAKTSIECSSSEASDTTNKQCIFYNNQCTEQFKTCASYTGNVVQETCENIILSDNTKKCSLVSNVCTQGNKVCSDFKFESIRESCENIIPLNIKKKCVFSNNVCSESNRNCLDLANQVGVTADICSSATTSDSNTKTCSLKEDKSGCEEVNKSSDQQSPSQGNNNNSNGSKNPQGETKKNQEETNDNNFAGEKSISKLLLIMISLLF